MNDERLNGPCCGNCKHCMIMPDCPKEYKVHGGHRGPDMYGNICTHYTDSRLPEAWQEKTIEKV